MRIYVFENLPGVIPFAIGGIRERKGFKQLYIVAPALKKSPAYCILRQVSIR